MSARPRSFAGPAHGRTHSSAPTRGEVTPPYGSNAGGAQQRADVVGIGPYVPRGDERAARRGRRALRVVAESRRDCPGQRRTAEHLRRGREEWVGIGAETIPKRGQQLRTIPQSRRSRDSSCCGAQNSLLACAHRILTAATPFCSLLPPLAALANVPLSTREPWEAEAPQAVC